MLVIPALGSQRFQVRLRHIDRAPNKTRHGNHHKEE